MSEFIQALPKFELHVHLEGSIRPATLFRLFQRHGNTDFADVEDVGVLYRHRDFLEFLEHFKYIHSWLKDE